MSNKPEKAQQADSSRTDYEWRADPSADEGIQRAGDEVRNVPTGTSSANSTFFGVHG
jgi:hypothetical protein